MADQNRRSLFASAMVAIVLLISPATLALCGLGQSVDVEATVAAGIVATQQAAINLQATVDAAIAATQVAAAPSTPPSLLSTPIPLTPIPVPLTPFSDPEQVRTVILSEVNGTVAQDLTLLKSLYAPDAIIIDRNGTPDDSGDDTTWQGWANIERRYLAFFSARYASLTLVDLSIQVDGNQATGTHQGVVMDGTLFKDRGVYTLAKLNGQWLITQLEYGYEKGNGGLPGQAGSEQEAQPPRDDGLYVLKVGNQHRYEEPWGGDRGDPCKAWETNDFDDTQPNHRGFNVELLLTNNSEAKAPDAWPISFTTAKGKSVKACYYGYAGSGPSPGATSSVTFFTVVEKGDYVERITFSLNGQTVQLCLDGQGGWSSC
ncbi:MAG TPA: nuclear transport factor 2 family protein [Anaerolineae bacterium]|nr:nuclear transport factor 2 family protein [Anaerolineae bacterium]